MRTASTVLLLLLAVGTAHANDYEACRSTRRKIYAQAMVAHDLQERGRLLRTMPECHAREIEHSSTLRPAPAVPVAPPRTSVSFEPVALLLTTISVDVERQIVPHLGIALVAETGHTSRVLIGDRVNTYFTGDSFADLETVTFTMFRVGGQLNYYVLQSFRGLQCGFELAYRHFGLASPDRESIQVIEASPYVGWKWVGTSGLTGQLQVGASAIYVKDRELTSAWSMDRNGSLGDLHVFGSLSFGVSF